jgi:hypothetical protein
VGRSLGACQVERLFVLRGRNAIEGPCLLLRLQKSLEATTSSTCVIFMYFFKSRFVVTGNFSFIIVLGPSRYASISAGRQQPLITYSEHISPLSRLLSSSFPTTTARRTNPRCGTPLAIREFGHIAITVPDVQAACARFEWARCAV